MTEKRIGEKVPNQLHGLEPSLSTSRVTKIRLRTSFRWPMPWAPSQPTDSALSCHLSLLYYILYLFEPKWLDWFHITVETIHSQMLRIYCNSKVRTAHATCYIAVSCPWQEQPHPTPNSDALIVLTPPHFNTKAVLAKQAEETQQNVISLTNEKEFFCVWHTRFRA